ncbi:MAG TPA: 16S rRNA (guanine(527)-N(7))-methyltransferase RsmG [Solirubrobacterales bacterium]
MTDPLDRLDEAGRAQLAAVVAMVAGDERAPSSVRDPEDAWRVHVADSLSGLELEPLATARRIADVGSGVGFPGLALAAALPEAEVDLVESLERKCEFMRRAVERGGLVNVGVVCERAEDWARKGPTSGGREVYDAVTARAVGRLSTLAELASPLLRGGGVLVAWKGKKDAGEEAEMNRASKGTGMEVEEVRWVGPYAGSRHRHLYLLRKVGPTPEGLPRRAGMAKKRPMGS